MNCMIMNYYDSWRNVCVHSRVPNISEGVCLWINFVAVSLAACCRKFFSILMIYSLFRRKDGVWGRRLMSLRSDFFHFCSFCRIFCFNICNAWRLVKCTGDDLFAIYIPHIGRFRRRPFYIHVLYEFRPRQFELIDLFDLQCDHIWTGLR